MYFFSAKDEMRAWNSRTRAVRLTSSDVHWRVIVEAVSTAEHVSRYRRRTSNAQIVIGEEHFHITALRIEGFHPTQDTEGGTLGELGSPSTWAGSVGPGPG
eukprot:15449151-Alexandrium_andersonii.AAC.1